MSPSSRASVCSKCCEPLARFWQRSYAPDYVGIIILIVGYILILLSVEPFHGMFSLDDNSIQFPHALVERVPVLWLMIYAVVIPCLVITVWSIVRRPGSHKVHVTFLGLLISVILTVFLTDTVKNLVGRPRPDLISRCKPKDGTPSHDLVAIDVCSETNHHILHDGWRSFPSGHSSLSFSGLGYLSLFFCGQLRVFHPGADLVKGLIAIAPLLGALYIATSRLEDYRHDFYDVTIGSILGYSIALLSYRRYYPRLRAHTCEVPHQNRATEKERGGLKRYKADEEAGPLGSFSIADPEDDPEAIPLNESNRGSG